MITLTSYPEFATWITELKKEIYQLQSNLLDRSENWDQVVFSKGFAAGISMAINLRKTTIAAKDNAMADDANV